MIGRTTPAKPRLSTSKQRISQAQSSSTYQQLEPRNLLATFVVTTADDIVADDGLVSLREAVTAANTNQSFSDIGAGDETGDRIVFSPDVREERFVLNAQLEIQDDLAIRGFNSNNTGLDTRIEGSGNRILSIETEEPVYIRDIEFNTGVENEGGLVRVAAGGNVTFKSSSLLNGVASIGGAVHATDSRIVFDETRIAGNRAEASGGGVWAQGGELLFLGFFNADSNIAVDGGAVHISGEANLYASGGFFTLNRTIANGAGGAIWAGEGTNVDARGVTFQSNGSVGEQDVDEIDSRKGGAIAAYGQSLRVIQSNFRSNVAGLGGAVYSTADSSNFIQNRLDFNKASSKGGAGWFSGPATRFFGGLIDNNSSDGFGGGLHFAFESSNSELPAEPTQAVVRNVTLTANSADTGGAISSTSDDLRVLHSTFSENAATRRGGGIYASGDRLFVLDTLFETNSTDGNGGAVTAFGSNGLITNSTFKSNSAAGGGAISLRANADIAVRSTGFDSNNANAGGAINVGGNSTLRSLASTFESNIATNSGGGIYVVASGRFSSRGSSFTSNSAASEGGAILSYGSANIGDTSFVSNRASRGGAIKVGGATGLVSIIGATSFTSNFAAANGSAVSSTSGSITLINDAVFEGNVVESDFGELLFIGEVGFHRVTNSDFR